MNEHRIKKVIFFLLILIFVVSEVQGVEEIIFPPPPEKSRIRFLQELRGPADLKIKKSFLTKIWEFLVGEEPEEFGHPFAVAVRDEKIVVTDTKKRGFHIFDLGRNNYRIVVPRVVNLSSPVGAHIARDGRLFIVDSLLKKIFIFDIAGKFQGEFAHLFPFQRPTGIFSSPYDGSLWVVDTLAHQVISFNPAGEKLFILGKRGTKEGEFNYPTGITIGKDGRIYICDTLNARIQMFSPVGKFISAFGKRGDSTGDFSHPKAIALDSEGHLYVVDGLFDAIQIFDEKGRLLLVFGQRGSRRGEFYVPTSLCIDESDRIFVVDSYNQRLQIFQYLREY